MVLEETLVVGHTVLTEHEAMRIRAVSMSFVARAKSLVHAAPELQLDPERPRRKFGGRTLKIGFVRRRFCWRIQGDTYPAMRELVARNIFAVGGGKERGLEVNEGVMVPTKLARNELGRCITCCHLIESDVVSGHQPKRV